MEDGSYHLNADQIEPPNGEYDCLYLDMNCIVHPCCHPEDSEEPEGFDQMFQLVFAYIDRIFSLIQPKQVLFLAIDGVAPRAKMNQQRQRRFKAALEAEENELEYEELRREFARDGKEIPLPKSKFDSNIITPGTPFMHALADALKWYIQSRFNTLFKNYPNLKVFLSDANNPGEGEHKIMDFIRSQRASEGYNPNMRHCLYGADADLIMLGLATHEPYFHILREIVPPPTGPRCRFCSGPHDQNDCPKLGKKETDEEAQARVEAEKAKEDSEKEAKKKKLKDDNIAAGGGSCPDSILAIVCKQMTLIRINVLREYLAVEFSAEKLKLPLPDPNNDPNTGLPPIEKEISKLESTSLSNSERKGPTYSLDRIVDDFVFMCFFIGNDFLPHLPSLSIHKGSIDQMITLYTTIIHSLPDYLQCAGHVNFQSTSQFVAYLGDIEDEVFKNEARRQHRMEQQREEQKAQSAVTRRGPSSVEAEVRSVSHTTPAGGAAFDVLKKPSPLSSFTSTLHGEKRSNSTTLTQKEEEEKDEGDADQTGDASKRRRLAGDAIKLSEMGAGDGLDTFDPKSLKEVRASGAYVPSKRQRDIDEFREKQREKSKKRNEMEGVKDIIGLGISSGWREKYYRHKFHLTSDDSCDEMANNVAKEYILGLAWVLRYYYSGVPSWGWFYPFHYAPLASDLVKFAKHETFVKSSLRKSANDSAPFTPFQQLMAVLPARSGVNVLPPELSNLMIDTASSISDFYPLYFGEDPDGKRFRWQWVVLVPFIDPDRLQLNTRPIEAKLSAELQQRNQRGEELVFVSQRHPSYEHFAALAEGKIQYEHKEPFKDVSGGNMNPKIDGIECIELLNNDQDAKNSTLMFGRLAMPSASSMSDGAISLPGESIRSSPWSRGVETNRSVCIAFRMPPPSPHLCKYVPGAVDPTPILDQLERDEAGAPGGERLKMFGGPPAKKMMEGLLRKKGFFIGYQQSSNNFHDGSGGGGGNYNRGRQWENQGAVGGDGYQRSAFQYRNDNGNQYNNNNNNNQFNNRYNSNYSNLNRNNNNSGSSLYNQHNQYNNNNNNHNNPNNFNNNPHRDSSSSQYQNASNQFSPDQNNNASFFHSRGGHPSPQHHQQQPQQQQWSNNMNNNPNSFRHYDPQQQPQPTPSLQNPHGGNYDSHRFPPPPRHTNQHVSGVSLGPGLSAGFRSLSSQINADSGNHMQQQLPYGNPPSGVNYQGRPARGLGGFDQTGYIPPPPPSGGVGYAAPPPSSFQRPHEEKRSVDSYKV